MKTDQTKADLRRAAERGCNCLGYPPPCEACVARSALQRIEELEADAKGPWVKRRPGC